MTVKTYVGSADLIARSVLVSQWVSGCEITISGGGATFDIAPGVLQWVDSSSAVNTTVTEVVFPGAVGVVPAISTGTIYVEIDRSLNVIQSTSVQEHPTLNEKIQIGIVSINTGIIFEIDDIVNVSSANIPGVLFDLGRTLRPLIIEGAQIDPAGSNLQVQVQSGSFFSPMTRYKIDPTNPNTVSINQKTFSAGEYIYIYRDGAGGWTTSILDKIDPAQYDDGSGTLISAGNAGWTVQRVYISSEDFLLVQYGQERYNNLRSAIGGLYEDQFLKFPAIDGAAFLGYIFLRGNCTDLSNTSRAVFYLPQTAQGEINSRIP